MEKLLLGTKVTLEGTIARVQEDKFATRYFIASTCGNFFISVNEKELSSFIKASKDKQPHVDSNISNS